ncbi:unnamed protein product [Menidia menidia]|uniref:(Atlantic silverside) hypothetical protein n=1 Tax=Menidia menidia TaxID=238744 RepID=A0A8S4B156_9TELE|nr:unnamed protein product [Menidia menidia]
MEGQDEALRCLRLWRHCLILFDIKAEVCCMLSMLKRVSWESDRWRSRSSPGTTWSHLRVSFSLTLFTRDLPSLMSACHTQGPRSSVRDISLGREAGRLLPLTPGLLRLRRFLCPDRAASGSRRQSDDLGAGAFFQMPDVEQAHAVREAPVKPENSRPRLSRCPPVHRAPAAATHTHTDYCPATAHAPTQSVKSLSLTFCSGGSA